MLHITWQYAPMSLYHSISIATIRLGGIVRWYDFSENIVIVSPSQ